MKRGGRGWGSSAVMILYRTAPPHYKTYQKSGGNCKVHKEMLRYIKCVLIHILQLPHFKWLATTFTFILLIGYFFIYLDTFP
jgi:hypothetical protein